MSLSCNVCGSTLVDLLFRSGERFSLTTMNTLVDGETSVYYCRNCDHVQTEELPDLARYYAKDYEINIESADEDQLYAIEDGKKVYRAEHQARVLAEKIDLTNYPNILDYGCAKAHTVRAISALVPETKLHMFDVTDKYIPFWEKIPGATDWAAFEPKADWHGKMDILLSFYALEHIPDLSKMLDDVKKLLRDGGLFYFIVPNLYENVADFIVADHVNHFGRNSLRMMLERAGFQDITIDETVHTAAFVVHARNSLTTPDVEASIAPEMEADARDIASFWSEIKERVQAFEAALPDDDARVIYGAGIYGNFLFSCLRHPERVAAFLDQNKFLVGKDIKGVPIRDPSDVPNGTRAVLVGLNPRFARKIIADIGSLQEKCLKFLFLDAPGNN